MSKQQTKRRRKRYEPGSAYAGHVRPRGIFSIFGNVRLFFILGVAIMLGSLGIGGFISAGSLLSGGNGGNNPLGFVDQSESETTPEGTATPAAKLYEAPPAMTIDATKAYTATIKTSLGNIVVALTPVQAAQTVNNFVFLAREGFYDGLTFHQVQSDFSVQAGDPACVAGGDTENCRGTGGPGYDLPPETSGTYSAGTLGMANGSQFFIALTGSSAFERYTPFGTVTSGLEIARRIALGTEIESVTIDEQ